MNRNPKRRKMRGAKIKAVFFLPLVIPAIIAKLAPMIPAQT